MKNDLSKYNVKIWSRTPRRPSADIFGVVTSDERDEHGRPLIKYLKNEAISAEEPAARNRRLGTHVVVQLYRDDKASTTDRATVLDRRGNVVAVRAPTHGVLNRAKAVIAEHQDVITNLANR
ncbi:hypothetical protein [Paracidovorax citrulli]